MIRKLLVGLVAVAGLGCSDPTAPEPVGPSEISPVWQPRWNRVPGYIIASPVCKKNAVGSCSGNGKSGLGGLKSSF